MAVLKAIAAFLACAGLVCVSAPAAEQLTAIAPGVSVLGTRLGGLTAQPAGSTIARRFARPIVIVAGAKRISVAPAQLGARAAVDAAVRSALSATPGSRIALPVRYSAAAVAEFVGKLAKATYRPPRDAVVLGADAKGPTFRPSRNGVAVRQATMRAAIVQELTSDTRAPIDLMTAPVPPSKTVANFGPVIVVTRGANRLRLFEGRRLVRTFPVATGQAIYPTPAGIWQIKDKQMDPWWYPPTYDAWAKGLKPVPPGPSNPLGTRWMGLTAPGVGIHGTDAETSIGYSVSHGCIRMHVADAEWLYPHVHVGTTVVIL
ncbi:MAG: L,D-transpeptidase family protein [Actinobacteria bacterium]|nr:L,D-transpeptidase family protein [Actinomycetota bacterium]MBV8396978.1 L,D-transpeptidase family protein [Actinomycetota bacterium]MBV8599780.1 L,D-transpeptidase family protein [Actinomycetota bacterium]